MTSGAMVVSICFQRLFIFILMKRWWQQNCLMIISIFRLLLLTVYASQRLCPTFRVSYCLIKLQQAGFWERHLVLRHKVTYG